MWKKFTLWKTGFLKYLDAVKTLEFLRALMRVMCTETC